MSFVSSHDLWQENMERTLCMWLEEDTVMAFALWCCGEGEDYSGKGLSEVQESATECPTCPW